MIDASFFIPIYNPNVQWLKEAVESIVRLARKNRSKIELLLGDDGSTTDIGNVLDAFQAKYPDLVKVFHFEKNEGVGAASTKLARAAQGRYIASFDQDDIMLAFDLDEEIRILDENPQYSASYAQKFLFNEYGLTGEVHGDIWSDFLAFFPPKININAMLIRRETLASHEYFKPLPCSRINHDIWLMLRLAEDGDYCYRNRMPRLLYRSHQKQNSLQEDNSWDWHFIGQDIITRHGELYREILLGEKLPYGRDDKENVLIDRLTGLAFFLNQARRHLSESFIEKAVARYPQDPGAHQIRLLFNRRCEAARFDRVYDEATELFKHDSDALLQIVEARLMRNQDLRIREQALWEQYRHLAALRTTPPPIVTEAVGAMHFEKKHAPATYSFNFSKPTLK
ncbi:MAG: glycosyltransferase [Victivallaceae bacterium]|nr:glycosyltransferase [Victivallaceae bacterium]